MWKNLAYLPTNLGLHGPLAQGPREGCPCSPRRATQRDLTCSLLCVLVVSWGSRHLSSSPDESRFPLPL